MYTSRYNRKKGRTSSMTYKLRRHGTQTSYFKQKFTHFHRGQQWFTFLKKKKGRTSLLDLYNELELSRKLIICYNPMKDKRYFTVFEAGINFYNYLVETEESKRNFHEVILNTCAQKIHFDIDIDSNSVPESKLNEVFLKTTEELIDSVIEALKEFDVELNIERDVYFFTSHGLEETIHKRSAHLIIDNYCFPTGDDFATFYDKVVMKMRWKQFVDPAVRSRKHDLRCFLSRKPDSSRVKILGELNYKGKTYKHECNDEQALQSSLVTQTLYCQMLPSIYKPKMVDYNREISDEIVEKAISLIDKDVSKFKYESRIGNLIVLRNVNGYLCPICERKHEHQNPFLVVDGCNVRFYCRRSIEKRYIVYTLPEFEQGLGKEFQMQFNKGEIKKSTSEEEEEEACLVLFDKKLEIKKGDVIERSSLTEEEKESLKKELRSKEKDKKKESVSSSASRKQRKIRSKETEDFASDKSFLPEFDSVDSRLL